jgi:hypothetical protein
VDSGEDVRIIHANPKKLENTMTWDISRNSQTLLALSGRVVRRLVWYFGAVGGQLAVNAGNG